MSELLCSQRAVYTIYIYSEIEREKEGVKEEESTRRE